VATPASVAECRRTGSLFQDASGVSDTFAGAGEIVEQDECVDAASAAADSITSMSELPAAALLITDTHHVKQWTTRTPTAPPDMRPVLLDSDVIHAVRLVHAGPAEIVTDSFRASVRTEYTRDDLLSNVRMLFSMCSDVGLFMRE